MDEERGDPAVDQRRIQEQMDRLDVLGREVARQGCDAIVVHRPGDVPFLRSRLGARHQVCWVVNGPDVWRLVEPEWVIPGVVFQDCEPVEFDVTPEEAVEYLVRDYRAGKAALLN